MFGISLVLSLQEDSEILTGIDLHHFSKKLVDVPFGKRGHTLQLSSASYTQYARMGQAILLAAVGRKYYLYQEDQEALKRFR